MGEQLTRDPSNDYTSINSRFNQPAKASVRPNDTVSFESSLHSHVECANWKDVMFIVLYVTIGVFLLSLACILLLMLLSISQAIAKNAVPNNSLVSDDKTLFPFESTSHL